MSRYRVEKIAVASGTLSVGVWEPEAGVEAELTILASHGITSNHLAWTLLADQLKTVRILAPDLRGRGRSNQLEAPFGMRQHVEDLTRVLDSFEVEKAVLFGHSMGGFVSVIFAHLLPRRVSSIFLIDGGLPIQGDKSASQEELLQATLGPTAERLARIFSSRADYRNYWLEHPAFKSNWNQLIEDYLNYDLDEVEGGFKPATNYQAMAADSEDIYGGELLENSLSQLQHPTVFLRSPLGLFAEPPGLYPAEQVAEANETLPNFVAHEITQTNHYTILMSEAGVSQILPFAQQVIELAKAETTSLSNVQGA